MQLHSEALSSLEGEERKELHEFLRGSETLPFSYVSEPSRREAFRLFCRLISAGQSGQEESLGWLKIRRFRNLLEFMDTEESFNEFRVLALAVVDGTDKPFLLIGKLAEKDTFRRLFRMLLDEEWLLPTDDEAAEEMLKVLHEEFAYQEGRGPKPTLGTSDDDGTPFLVEDIGTNSEPVSMRDSQGTKIKIGSPVQMCHLESKPEWNGRNAVVIKRHNDGRCAVRLDTGEEFAVKATNLDVQIGVRQAKKRVAVEDHPGICVLA